MHRNRVNVDPNERHLQDPQIIPQTKDIEFQSEVSDEAPIARQSSNMFDRLMSLDTKNSMSSRNLLMHNAVFRKRVCSIAVNVVARILTLCMNIVMLILSCAYCIAQLSDVHLMLLKECTPKTKEEIYHHSYLAGLQEDGSVTINKESQWGHTDDACYTTKSYQMDTDRLWYSNVYEHEWTGTTDVKAVFFGMLAVYSFCILMYNLRSIMVDISHLRKNTLHILSNRNEQSTGWRLKFIALRQRLERLLEDETSRWIIRCLVLEILEFGGAIISMMLYNGYWWMDPDNEDDVYLAQKPHFIKLFSSVIAFNMFGSAFLWSSYALFPGTCYGLTFRVMMFFVDDLSDLFYTIFPLLVIYMDDYNANVGDLSVFLGQLHLDNAWTFLSAFGFLFVLCTKSLHLTYSASNALHNRYYEEFEKEDAQISWIHEDPRTQKKKKMMLLVVACVYAAGAILVPVMVTGHMHQAETYCNSITESRFIVDDVFSVENLSEEQFLTLEKNPELLLWDYCQYQTYPFSANELLRCQCRVFVLDLEASETFSMDRNQLGLNEKELLSSLLRHSWMLEKLSCSWNKAAGAEDPFVFEESMMRAIRLKAFQWHGLGVVGLDEHIASWTQLQYVSILAASSKEHSFQFAHFGKLSSLQYVYYDAIHLKDIGGMEGICNLKALHVFELHWNGLMDSIPHCFKELQQLRILVICGNRLKNVPQFIFGLPHLKMLTIFGASQLTLENFVSYNSQSVVEQGDSEAIHEWFHTNFHFNEQTQYFLQSSALCEASVMELSILPSEVADLIHASCTYSCSGGAIGDQLCQPQRLGDGICDWQCNSVGCNYDEGDCIQLCFAEELTECNWFKLLNDQCDPQCDNKYCCGYGEAMMYTEQVQMIMKERNGVLYGADFHQCPYTGAVSNDVCTQSAESNPYLDFRTTNNSKIQCKSHWIGDGICDDACNVPECSNDAQDCDQECGGACGLGLVVWQLSDPLSTFKLEHNKFCSDVWPILMSLETSADSAKLEDCAAVLELVDFNKDGFFNFRECSALTYKFMFESDTFKEMQINCSSCVGMENYDL